MTPSRHRALQEFASHEAKRFFEEKDPISSYFGQNVFDLEKMKLYLPPQAYNAVLNSVQTGRKLDRSIAGEVAGGMKTWAVERGATHYTHWFHPLTDATAEKHEAFVDKNDDGIVIEHFKGDTLVQQEPDASSFPSGGLRNTFEARGYTAWDPSSPAFIIDQTLCIPTIFVSYTGEALDLKTPLLRSLQAVDKYATDLASMFDPATRHVNVMLGIEQEYFVVDLAFYRTRQDLMLCGRTLQGHNAAKDQQLEDHYFGNIPSRVMAFMKDFETEAYKLGVLLKTRHNEVAPNQFEFAPLYSEANLAIDQNQMMMLLMRKIAKKHFLRVIFHEKPFAGVNGSGKHCNWSLVTDRKVNLLSPGKTPQTNLQFLSFFAATMRAVYEHHYLLMASVASLSNSYRLGGSEAPPAILSLFMGSTLTKVFDSLESKEMPNGNDNHADRLDIVSNIPEILADNTDRNRTSPFAFTGNRFEFRAVGSSANCATAMIPLNAAVAQQLKRFRQLVLETVGNGMNQDMAVMHIIRQFVRESRKIRFEGNGYSRQWQEDAARRGLRGITSVPEAYDAYLEPSVVKLMEEMKILSHRELEARVEVKNEAFVKKLQIEARVLGDMVINHIIPTAVRYQNILLENAKGLKELFNPVEYQQMADTDLNTIRMISQFIQIMHSRVDQMVEARKTANNIENIAERARSYSQFVLPFMEEIRDAADQLEMIVDDEFWPLPKYREMMFLR